MRELTRRDALRAAAGLVSVGAVGTAAGRLGSVPPADSLDAVPAVADALASANVDRLRRDDEMETLTDTALHLRSQFGAGDSVNTETLLADIEARSDTDPRHVHGATVFTALDGGEDGPFGDYRGAVLEADLTAEAVKDGVANFDDIAFEELRRSGSVVYEPETDDGLWVGSLPSGNVVVGTEPAVSDAVDAANGEAPSLDGTVENAYRDTGAAPVRFAARMPSPYGNDGVPTTLDGDGDRSVDLGPLETVSVLAGSVSADSGVLELSATLWATDSDAAGDVAATVTDVRDYTAAELEDDAVADLVGDVGVRRRGSAVQLSVERTAGQLRSLTGDGASY